MDSFLQFFSLFNPIPEIAIWPFLRNLLLTALLSLVLSRVYVRFGDSLSNRELFARNFLLLSMTTMMIFTFVKSSAALALGLVGALSIIRFRAAIKEPEELCYLFLTIGLGLGMGAEQSLVTTIAFLVIVGLVILRKLSRFREPEPSLYLTISRERKGEPDLGQLLRLVDSHARSARLRRMDESGDCLEVSFQTQFPTTVRLRECVGSLRKLDPGMTISLVDDRGIGA